MSPIVHKHVDRIELADFGRCLVWRANKNTSVSVPLLPYGWYADVVNNSLSSGLRLHEPNGLNIYLLPGETCRLHGNGRTNEDLLDL